MPTGPTKNELIELFTRNGEHEMAAWIAAMTDDEFAACMARFWEILANEIEAQGDSPMTTDDLPRADFACLDIDGHDVYVMDGGTQTCGHGHSIPFISIGVRDTASDNEVIARSEYRELINLNPADAIRVARALLDYAEDMVAPVHIDDEADGDETP
jgi:hypothetical protein